MHARWLATIPGLAACLVAARPAPAWAQGVSVTLSQGYAQLVPGQPLAFSATVTGGDGAVTWQVDTVTGGTAASGTITADGHFTAPATLPNPASVTITAVSQADPRVTATATVTLLAQARAGRTLYVATTGSDAAPGSLADPFRTIQHAASLAVAGDTVLVRGGTYTELVTPRNAGTASALITYSSYPGELAVIDGTGLPVPGGQNGLVTLAGLSDVVVQGFELRNYTTASTRSVPVGIYVTGAGDNVQLVNNHVHHIATTAHTTPSACSSNALGIAVYGSRAPAAITGLVVSGNELDHLTTGCSESMSIDGNVDGFAITSNRVHDNDNIGIDAIGFERVSPDPAYDQARHGEIRGNAVFDITSYGNPDYGKHYAADGIYVDGGTNIIIEQNTVYAVDYGIELASEHPGRLTSTVTARNNLIYSGNASGITIGGYGPKRGGTDHCAVVGNTLFDNAAKDGTGEIQIQYNATNNLIENNIVFAGPAGLLLHAVRNAGPAPAALDHNVFYAAKPSAAAWQLAGHTYRSFAAYQAATDLDAHSTFADPLFDSTATPPSLSLMPRSPAFGAGIDLGAATLGTTDFAGNPRVTDGAVTSGAYEQ